MKDSPLPLTRDLVLIGGGHAHALVLKRWGMAPLPGARLTLINPGPTAPYTGMLPGFVAGHYPRGALEIDLVKLARFAGARLILGHADGIDTVRQRVSVAGRGEIGYDIASVDIGITSAMPDLPGFAEHGVAAKPLGAFADRWTAFLARSGPAEIVLIGAGVAGAELAMAMAHALGARGRAASITLIDNGDALPGVAPATARRIRQRLGRAGITLLERRQVARIGEACVVLADGSEIASQLTVGAAGAQPWTWLVGTGLAMTAGYLDVDLRLRTSDPAIFAAGDCAHLTHAPRPKAGVYAVRAAKVLGQNLRAALTGETQVAFHPQADFLKLISLGGRDAVGEKFGLTLAGPAVWRWKGRIDRRFMERLARFPEMTAPRLPREMAAGVREALAGGKPLCGGCGAKVGAEALARALDGVALPTRPDVDRLPGDDSAVVTLGAARQVISTDHLRAFTEDPYLMARIAAVHAMGDIWAMGAVPQAALATLILPRMSEALQERWLQEIMEGAALAFGAAGAAVAGGHTSLGPELTIGFSVTGLLSGDPITRGGARPGDALVLTRPIGSGTILAAEMALKAPGDAVSAALEVMAVPQGPAAQALAGAHAMTDVTGFGLAGHLWGICRDSGVSAEVELDAVPFYEGAAELAAEGIRSTLFPANEAAVRPYAALPDDPRVPLLFDPQTAGGLLAALAPEDAARAVETLRAQGIAAARIGRVEGGMPALRVR